jgi:hypothetical protein
MNIEIPNLCIEISIPTPTYNPDIDLTLLNPDFEAIQSCSRPVWLSSAHITLVEMLLGADLDIGMPFCVYFRIL